MEESPNYEKVMKAGGRGKLDHDKDTVDEAVVGSLSNTRRREKSKRSRFSTHYVNVCCCSRS